MEFIARYLAEVREVTERIDQAAILKLIDLLADVRDQGGRLFFLGVGGSAATPHTPSTTSAKFPGFEAYSPLDNVSELTARINDDGWEGALAAWLRGSRLTERDMLMIFSVGGGDVEHNVSMNLGSRDAWNMRRALAHGLVASLGGMEDLRHAWRMPASSYPWFIPRQSRRHSEAFQAVVWHLLVSHPRLLRSQMKWESIPLSQPTG